MREDKKLVFSVVNKGEVQRLAPEQVVGAFLHKLKCFFTDPGEVAEAVVAVPPFFSAVERQAVLDACKIGGIKCLKLLNENTAVALAYGFFRRKEFDEKTPRNVAFLDLGHGSASVTIASFTQKKVKIISHNSDRNLGARSFDYTLMKKLAHEFEAKYGCNPLETPKTRLRLLEAIEKGRIMLSANQEVQINVECLMEDEDLSRHLTRDEFIVMIEPDLERLNALLEKTLAESGLTPSDIHSVEMIGEATRIPIVQDRAQDVFK